MNQRSTQRGLWCVGFALACALGACAPTDAPMTSEEEGPMTVQVTSSAFTDGAAVPEKYTADGQDVSPPLAWSGVPEGAKSIALICDDPDAPGRTWVHWVLYGLPATATGLPEGVPTTPTTPQGAKQGTNSWPRMGYGGPSPPPGKPHRYVFKVYALDSVPDLAPGAKKEALLRAMEGHILAEGHLTGTYGR